MPRSHARRLPELLLHRVHGRRRFVVRKRQRLKRPRPTLHQVPSASARRGGRTSDLNVVNIAYHLIVHLFFHSQSQSQSESIRQLSRPRRMHLRHRVHCGLQASLFKGTWHKAHVAVQGQHVMRKSMYHSPSIPFMLRIFVRAGARQ